MKLREIVLGSVCGLVLANVTLAQLPSGGRAANQTGQARVSPPAQGSLQDVESVQNSTPSMQQAIEACLSLDNQADVILATLATEKGKHEDVIAFAKKIHSGHVDCLAELNKIAPWLANQQPLTAAGTIASSVRTKAAQNKPAQTTTSNPQINGQPDGDSTMLEMQAELAQQCLIDTQAMMTKDSGKNFDECYVGMQLAKHAAMHSKLTVFQRHTSGELNQFITSGLAKNKSMMADADALMKRLAAAASSDKNSE